MDAISDNCFNKEKEMNAKPENISNNNPEKESKGLLMNIKSPNFTKIINHIFEYTDENNFKHKLFNYSKYFQKRLNIQSYEYKYKSNALIFLRLEKFYLCKENEKEIKAQNLEEYLNYFNITKEDIYNYIRNESYKSNYSFRDFIDIYSPLFEFLSKKDNFEFFLIKVEKEPKDNYNKAFNELKLINANYSIDIHIDNNDDINYFFKKTNINFNKLKGISITNKDGIDNNILFKSFFSFNDLKNSLTCLKIEFNVMNKIVDANIMDDLNNFKSLSVLHLFNIIFENQFILKINSLKQLKIFFCENIGIDSNCSSNITYFSLCNTQLLKSDSLLKFPNVEYYESPYSINNVDHTSIIDFSSLKKMNKFFGNINEFIKIDCQRLNELILWVKDSSNLESNKIAMEKLSSIKDLKHLNITYHDFNGEIKDLLNIKGKINALKSFIVFGIKVTNNQMFQLQDKFPNLIGLHITIYNNNLSQDLGEISNIEIKESPNSKLTGINIPIYGNYIDKINIQSYEKLSYLYFDIKNKIKNLENIIPIFSDKCNIIFKSLKALSITFNNNVEIDLNILNNVIKNIDKLPRLTSILLNGYSKEINENYYLELIKNILTRKIAHINISISNVKYAYTPEYSDNELKVIYPDFNPSHHCLVSIKKLNNNNN